VVYTLVSYGWAGLAGAFAPSITLSFWWKKFSKAGVYAAFIVGIITTVAWIASGLDALLTVRFASFVIPFPAAVIASLLFPKDKAKDKDLARGSQ
jgi:sodium/proline symporter